MQSVQGWDTSSSPFLTHGIVACEAPTEKGQINTKRIIYTFGEGPTILNQLAPSKSEEDSSSSFHTGHPTFGQALFAHGLKLLLIRHGSISLVDLRIVPIRLAPSALKGPC